MRLSENLEKRLFQTLIEEFSYYVKSSSSQFFITTMEIQSGPNAFDESRFVMTFLIILGIIEIFKFRLVLEGRAEIPVSSRLEILEKFLANNFTLSDAEDNTSDPLNRCRFTIVENTFSNSPNVPRAKYLGNYGLLYFSSICNLASRTLCNDY